jgi:hypothetical protein
MEPMERTIIMCEWEYTQQSQATLICDRGLGFRIVFISAYRHGKPFNFIIIKEMSTNITTEYRYINDLYGLSWNISAPSPDDSHHIYFASSNLFNCT